jgi:hypothetical protein
MSQVFTSDAIVDMTPETKPEWVPENMLVICRQRLVSSGRRIVDEWKVCSWSLSYYSEYHTGHDLVIITCTAKKPEPEWFSCFAFLWESLTFGWLASFDRIIACNRFQYSSLHTWLEVLQDDECWYYYNQRFVVHWQTPNVVLAAIIDSLWVGDSGDRPLALGKAVIELMSLRTWNIVANQRCIQILFCCADVIKYKTTYDSWRLSDPFARSKCNGGTLSLRATATTHVIFCVGLCNMICILFCWQLTRHVIYTLANRYR